MNDTLNVDDKVSWIGKISKRRQFGKIAQLHDDGFHYIRTAHGGWTTVHKSRLTKECG